ncbi:MAG: serine/threonine protein phosphatase PrpC [Flavobacteriales bacterium]|jgi:serine/threonine protein phosphatase PrpC
MFLIQSSALTNVGLQRNNNEDAYFSSANQGLWVVADGMGGHAAGEVASAIVIDTIQTSVSKGYSLQSAVQQSHHDILNAASNGVGGQGMGSTVVALRSQHTSYEICWVGDSRAYIYIPSKLEGEPADFRQLTTDHSYVQMLYQSGAISENELEDHPEKNIITQCLGSVELPEVQVDTIVGDWPENALMLLCSDGLSDIVRNSRIYEILAANTDLNTKNEALIQAALDAGGKDNITVEIIASPSRFNLFVHRMRKLFK